MDTRRIRIVVAKDLKELGANKMVVVPMIIVPLIFCVVLPGALGGFGLGLHRTDLVGGAEMLRKVLDVYPIPGQLSTVAERMVYVLLNYTFIPMFMIVPLMVASIVSANAIVGEKERKTLETLLYTPITNRELIVAKLAAAFLPALAVAVVGFAGYFVVGNAVSLLVAGIVIVRSWIWVPAMLLLVPAVSLLGLASTLLVSLKAKTFMEAQQTAGVVVLPLVLLVVVQVTGIVVFNALYVVLASLVLLGIDYLLISRVLPRFSREGIVTTL